MKVLVIGGTGNISFGTVNALLGAGHEVAILTRGIRADDLPDSCERVVADRRADRAQFEDTVAAGRYDAIIDMICFNGDDAASSLRAAAAAESHLVMCSTVATYGPHVGRLPTPESEPQRPVASYGEGKVAAERTLLSQDRVPVTIMRPSWTYGRVILVRQVGFMPGFIDRLRKRKPLVVVDTAWQTRWQSLHIMDAGVAFAYACGRESCFGNAYNVVGDEVMTWADYHRTVSHAIGAGEPRLVGLELGTIASADPESTRVLTEITAYDGWYTNSSIARDIPEFGQTIPFSEGVLDNVEWMQTRGLIADSDTEPWDLKEDALIASAGSLRRRST